MKDRFALILTLIALTSAALDRAPVKAVLFPFREATLSARAESELEPYRFRLGEAFPAESVLVTLDDVRFRIEAGRAAEQRNFAKAAYEDKKQLREKNFAEKDLYGVFAGGMLKGVLIAEKDGSHICAFFVKNGELRQGYGSKLMHRFLEYVPQKSVTVNAAPAAVNAYKKLGFVPEGGICHADGMTYLPMRRDPSPRAEHKPTGGTP